MAGEHHRSGPELTELTREFEQARRRLFGIAYRMLGSVAEAEDVVQDAWIRWQSADRSDVERPAAFLSTLTTRLAMNVATSARLRRETYIGPWLPEPIPTATDPALGAENSEALEVGILRLMEQLSPAERAVYILREAFGYSFAQIAEVIEVTEPGARQLARRARLHLSADTTASVTAGTRSRLFHSFIDAAQSGNLAGLHDLLTEDITVFSDGGGIVSAARRPISGRDRVERFLAGILHQPTEQGVAAITTINGTDAITLSRAGTVYMAIMFGATEHGINRLYFVLNPEKLGALSAEL